ncbi:citrate synthase [Paenibacillus sp. GCM10023248]|uniref:citrate synthase/methylcitrate synthase n=1 Tax=Bacillales TaxID=1385 RepID=UPI0023796CC5|nr:MULTISPECIES: citrate synthase/methylcitrate synthase [Bacillales]MDD9268687.1 citrate synthase/methylcitrate synthase [Paenibacillus sp. MAHUQ-63]MDR6880080.1 citrate synthase [Bacillus sp. 3255]
MASVTGLEGVVAAQTELSLVDGQKGYLVYRGHEAKELALHASFEEAAYLLWQGELPAADQLAAFKAQWADRRSMPAELKAVLDLLPKNSDTMSVLRTAVSVLGTAAAAQTAVWPPQSDSMLAYTAMLPTIIAYHYRRSQGLQPVEPDPQLDHVANYLYMLTGTVPEPVHVKALTAYFILAMEHGMNASTFAGRVVLSTQSDPASAICASIGAMKGPLHGGAPSEVLHMLDEIGAKERAGDWIRQELAAGRRLMGFGHRIYKTTDPRAEALRVMMTELASEDPWFDLAVHVEKVAVELLEEYKPGRKLYVNVEFYAAAVMRAIALPTSLFTPSFTLSRMVGWTAHLMEQAGCNRIFRPQSQYIGELPQSLQRS